MVKQARAMLILHKTMHRNKAARASNTTHESSGGSGVSACTHRLPPINLLLISCLSMIPYWYAQLPSCCIGCSRCRAGWKTCVRTMGRWPCTRALCLVTPTPTHWMTITSEWAGLAHGGASFKRLNFNTRCSLLSPSCDLE